MKIIRTEIEIKATAGLVWRILTGLAKYPEWNPFIHTAIGKAKVCEKVDITFRQGAKDMTLHCTVTKAEPNKQLAWKYHVGLPFLWQGEHSFTIEPLGAGRVRFIDQEVFTGLLIPLQSKAADAVTRRDFESMDKALKARAEKRRRRK